MVSEVPSCLIPGCPQSGKPLGGIHHEYPGHLFTCRNGVLPIRIVTRYCRGRHGTMTTFPLLISPSSAGCHTTYRPNYHVRDAGKADAHRVYALGLPDYIEVSEHTYVETALVNLFRAQMCFAQ